MSRNRARGTAAESAVVAYLRSLHWPHAERRALAGNRDRGDVNLGNGIGAVIEVKSVARIDLATIVDETTAETANANADIGAAWIKRRGTTDPGRWYVVMTGETFAELLRGWEREGP